MKSMTGSKKVVEMLNRYGHCVSYITTEEILTELTFSVTTAFKISPPDMQLNPFHLTILTGLWRRYLENTHSMTRRVSLINVYNLL